jgi:hypothetical protein
MHSYVTILILNNGKSTHKYRDDINPYFSFCLRYDAEITITDMDADLSVPTYEYCTFKWNSHDNIFVFHNKCNGKVFNELETPILDDGIHIKSYEWLQMMEIMQNKKVMFKIFGNEQYCGQTNLFDDIIEKTFIDYPRTITKLEGDGVIATKLSESQLATDPRVFAILDNENPLAITQWYEVDILGTPFGSDLADKIINLYKTKF